MDILSFSVIAEYIKKEINHKCGLNISQTRILLFFDKTKNEPLTMGKLAEGLDISLSTLSRQVQQQKTQSLISVLKSEKDSSKIVALNSNGLKKAKELKVTLSEIQNSLFSSLKGDTTQNFVDILNSLAKQSHVVEA
ncbi:MarR family winged helix-turn-helix transcriptional regulator [Lactobacillus agrestimuris]|uniref:MarR family winged helix-turn-helix transcriptional regulator n=1 Tax=Lactobacillus agrestimuris TaxID=2941328 RepID=UPI001989F7BB|nr:MarR family winged helix-turn-helix transcriptional regulator [Lactobacillus agrestimuris]MBD5430912.1 winged helix-turn-helix transcriptional regulator [Lactobacillus sp.]